MAVAKPFGLAPIRNLGASTWNEQTTRYWIPSTDTNAYYIGDAVKTISVAGSQLGADARGVPQVIIAAGTDTLRGVIVGVEPANVTSTSIAGPALALENTNIPATKLKDYYVYVTDDPQMMYTVQDDGITSAKLVAQYGSANFSLTIAAGATTVSNSGTVMLTSSLAATQGLNMKALGLMQGLNQGSTNVFGAFAIWLCKINQHELQGNTVGVV